MRSKWMMAVWIFIGLLFVGPLAGLMYWQRHRQHMDIVEHGRVLDEPPMKLVEETEELLPASDKVGIVVPFEKIGAVRSLFLAPNGRKVITVGEDNVVRLLEVKTAKELGKMSVGPNAGLGCFSPDGKQVAFCDWNSVVLYDLPNMQVTASMYMNEPGQAACAAFAPNGLTVLTGDSFTTVHVWNLRSQQPLGKLSMSNGQVLAVAYSADGRQVLAVDQNGIVRAWDIKTGQMLRQSSGQQAGVISAAFSGDGQMAVLGTADGHALVVETHGMTEASTTKVHNSSVDRVAITRDGTRVLTASGSDLSLWEAKTGRKLGTLQAPRLTGQRNLALLPDGRHVVVGGGSPGVYLMIGPNATGN